MAAATNIAAFNIAVNKFGVESEAKFRLLRDKLAFQALSGLVDKTPVDTGRARGNWQVTTGEPAAGELETTDSNGNGTISNGNGVIASTPTFGVVSIANNLPYIEKLENGHSGQAPEGMLALTFEELIAQFG